MSHKLPSTARRYESTRQASSHDADQNQLVVASTIQQRIVHCVAALFATVFTSAFVAEVNDIGLGWATGRVVLSFAAICFGLLLIGGSLRAPGTKQISLTSIVGLTLGAAGGLSLAKSLLGSFKLQAFFAAGPAAWFTVAVFAIVLGYILLWVLASFTNSMVWLAVDIRRYWRR